VENEQQLRTDTVSQYKSKNTNKIGETCLVETSTELQPLRDWIENLPGVSKAPHRFGGVEFQVQGLEFMHFHGASHMDIRLSKDDQTRVLEEGKAERHLFAPESGWVTVRIRSEGDVENAREVVQLAYSRAKRIMETHMARREPNKKPA